MYITISLLVLGSSTSVKLVSELLPVGLEPVVKNLVRGVGGYRAHVRVVAFRHSAIILPELWRTVLSNFSGLMAKFRRVKTEIVRPFKFKWVRA